jgi:hypothetical protein
MDDAAEHQRPGTTRDAPSSRCRCGSTFFVMSEVTFERIAPVVTVWTAARVEGRFIGPHDTAYGLREFVSIDPDGIVHRVGSPL